MFDLQAPLSRSVDCGRCCVLEPLDFLSCISPFPPPVTMPLSDFRVVEALGKGSFASVYKVMRKSDNKVYALKRVKIGKMSKREIADALNEIRFLASIRHKNIVGFLESFLENNESELCIVMEVLLYHFRILSSLVLWLW